MEIVRLLFFKMMCHFGLLLCFVTDSNLVIPNIVYGKLLELSLNKEIIKYQIGSNVLFFSVKICFYGIQGLKYANNINLKPSSVEIIT